MPFEDPDKDRQWRAKRRTPEYRNRNLATSQRWQARNRDKVRDMEYRRRLGISLKERDQIIQSNGGICHICNLRPSEHVDHCHKSDMIRGALCLHCNIMLGMAKDNPETLRSAAAYLERFAS